MVETADTAAVISKLNDLIELDYDAIAAYEEAVNRLDNIQYAEALTAFKNDHQRHVSVLSKIVLNLGGEPANSGDVKKVLTQGKVVLADIRGDKGILKAMHSNEKQTNKAYSDALQEFSGSSDIQFVIRENFDDEQRHKAWLEDAIEQYELEQERIHHRKHVL